MPKKKLIITTSKEHKAHAKINKIGKEEVNNPMLTKELTYDKIQYAFSNYFQKLQMPYEILQEYLRTKKKGNSCWIYS